MYAVKTVPGKGKGLVATRKIPKGTRILCEQALFTIPCVTSIEEQKRLICQQVEALSNGQRDAFLSMHNVHPYNNREERQKLITQQMEAMTDDQRDALQPISFTQWFDLPIGAMDNPQKHFLPIHELPELDAIFGEASRINHNCENNAQHYWKDDIKRLTVHALRDIHPGEEITTSYGSFPYNQKLRQVMLKQTLASNARAASALCRTTKCKRAT
ncbi:hypothetical protein E4U52_003428 [Claviceps spartinae]|nr:hypothetical protein E4U52_003428 [Claviceps spartinae]